MRHEFGFQMSQCHFHRPPSCRQYTTYFTSTCIVDCPWGWTVSIARPSSTMPSPDAAISTESRTADFGFADWIQSVQNLLIASRPEITGEPGGRMRASEV